MNFEKIRFTWRSGKSAYFPKIQEKSFHGIGQKLSKVPPREKADSPGQNFRGTAKILAENLGLVLGFVVITIVSTFIFVWYTALKRNL
jgi:hypothetical protein